MINTFTDLKEIIKDDKKLLVIRFGNVEVTDLLMDTIYDQMYSNAGFYCKEGDFVVMRSYSGTRFKVKDEEGKYQEFRLINDDSVEAVVEDPRGVSHIWVT